MCEWGHHVATLPVTNGTIRHTRRMTKILRITLPAEPPAHSEMKRPVPSSPGIRCACEGMAGMNVTP
eukprot:6206546-Pleurochrysis_carterae.AAC.5